MTRVTTQQPIGARFSRLTIVGANTIIANGKRRHRWQCLCDCGKTVFSHMQALRTGRVKSCGCLSREMSSVRRKHGCAAERRLGGKILPEFYVWRGMIGRCYCKSSTLYHRYGGRGITVCDRWRNDLFAFINDVGNRPSPKHTIDRINNDGNYEPGNCRWTTHAEQQKNKTDTHRVFFDGRSQTFAEIGKPLGIPGEVLYLRVLTLNHTIEEAVAMPYKYEPRPYRRKPR